MRLRVSSLKLFRLLPICFVCLVLIDLSSAQQITRRRPHHYPKFEILWPLHWVSAAYVWGFLKLGAIFAGLMLLFVVRHVASWNSGPTYIDHDAPVYHFRGFDSDETESASTSNDALYWTDKIEKAIEQFGERQL